LCASELHITDCGLLSDLKTTGFEPVVSGCSVGALERRPARRCPTPTVEQLSVPRNLQLDAGRAIVAELAGELPAVLLLLRCSVGELLAAGAFS
jgi:hypothetical protein